MIFKLPTKYHNTNSAKASMIVVIVSCVLVCFCVVGSNTSSALTATTFSCTGLPILPLVTSVSLVSVLGISLLSAPDLLSDCDD